VQFIEPNLGTRGVPTFVYDFPACQSPLAKSKNGLAERFELYINGVELVNGWTELTDAALQEENLHRENALRKRYGKQELPMDYGFVESLKQGMPECAGAAMGVDRLLMVLCDYSSIEEVIPFSSKELFGKN
jgi:lysyl-tRNA synthetase class 2